MVNTFVGKHFLFAHFLAAVTVMSYMSWYVKSLANWLFVEKLVQANSNKNINVLHYLLFVRQIHNWFIPAKV